MTLKISVKVECLIKLPHLHIPAGINGFFASYARLHYTEVFNLFIQQYWLTRNETLLISQHAATNNFQIRINGINHLTWMANLPKWWLKKSHIPGSHANVLSHWDIFVSDLRCNRFNECFMCSALYISLQSCEDNDFQLCKRALPYWPVLFDYQCQRLNILCLAVEDWEVPIAKILLGKSSEWILNHL